MSSHSRERRKKIADGVRMAWERRRRRSRVYLSGPITGLTPLEARRWRLAAARTLARFDIGCLDPMRRDEGHAQGRPIRNRFITKDRARRIYLADISDLKRCTVLLVDLNKPSLGTNYECGYAIGLGKPIVAFAKSPEVRAHPFVRGNGIAIFPTLREAVKHLIFEYGREEDRVGT